MKKLLLILFIGLSTFSNAQSSIQPNFGFNLWNLSFLGESDMTSYMEVGATYEHGLSDQLGINAGASYNFADNLDGGFFQLSLGGRYNFNELNNGAFAGAGFGYGFIEGGNYMEFGANFGYSIPLGPGSLNPNVGLGYMSVGSDGFRIGGLHIPINVSYSITL